MPQKVLHSEVQVPRASISEQLRRSSANTTDLTDIAAKLLFIDAAQFALDC
jgi:hypothetical protein